LRIPDQSADGIAVATTDTSMAPSPAAYDFSMNQEIAMYLSTLSLRYLSKSFTAETQRTLR